MDITLTIDQLVELGIDQSPHDLLEKIRNCVSQYNTPEEAWHTLSKKILTHYPFKVHLFLFSLLFPNWQDHLETANAWIPTKTESQSANITQFMSKINMNHIQDFHEWSYLAYESFWEKMVIELNIRFNKPYSKICDLSQGDSSPKWFPGASLNIIESCFTAPHSQIAIIYLNSTNQVCQMTYGELNNLVNQIANGLTNLGVGPRDAIGIVMPMTLYAVAIYLAIIKMGGIVVSIADSFSGIEIATRLNIAKAKAVFTQDTIHWNDKVLPLYEKIIKASDKLDNPHMQIVVLSLTETISVSLRKSDFTWKNFLSSNIYFKAFPCEPMAPCNLLFSSGTTAEPKAIIWNHTTPIKAASDAFFHQNIKSGDRLAWPTSLGWMMGPWLIFAALINHASLALYTDTPKDRHFGEFVQHAEVTMLGVVPTLVASWRQSQCMEDLDWQKIKVLSSTGECSNPEDMLYLMWLTHYQPIIEYCGGTEIGGAYVSSTVIQPNIPSLFSTEAMGLHFLILDKDEKINSVGEVAIVSPSIGLSTELWNADHKEIYFANMPISPDGKSMRRHGDQIKRLSNGYFSMLGRLDDTMNLGGIKISSTEIERAILGSSIPGIVEVAAIAIAPPDHGPHHLIIYAATLLSLNKSIVMQQMQQSINQHLNPLFKITDVIFVNELPKTASNKIMRRVLRKKYLELS